MKPLIGITTDHLPPKFDWSAKVYGQNAQYSDAIIQAGGLPVLLPYVEDRQSLRSLYEKLDGILFSGGDDIDPEYYDEERDPALGQLSIERDAMEMQLMKWAVADDKPVLAICRGHQVLNVALGGTLIQDIPSMVEGAQDHDLSTHKKDRFYIAHHLQFDRDSRIATIVGPEPIAANTHHHQAIKRPPSGLIVTARAEDQIIESVELPRTRFVIGVQCHPESLVQKEPRWGKLFREFVKASSYDTAYLSAASARSSSSTELPAGVLDTV